MKEITPSAELGELVVALLSKPHTPVRRDFIDRMLNKRKDPVLAAYLGDTLIWLHLMGRIQRDFHKPETHPGCVETVVWFWIADVDYDGYINATPDFSKYTILQILQDEKKQKPAAQLTATADEHVPDDAVIEDSEPEPIDLSSDPDVAEDLERVIDRLPAAEPIGKTMSTDKRILEWASKQDTPWTKAQCRAAVNADLTIFGMRLSYLITRGKIQQGQYRASEAFWHAENDAHPEFRANIKVGHWVKPVNDPKPVPEKVKPVPSIALAPPPPPRGMIDLSETAAPNFDQTRIDALAGAGITNAVLAPPADKLRPTVTVDAPNAGFCVDSTGKLTMSMVDLVIELSPDTMRAFSAFGRRYNLFNDKT